MKREYICISCSFIAYGVVGHSLQATNALVSVLTNVHKYNLIYFIIFYICFYKGYMLKPLKNKGFLLILSVLRNKQKISILDIKS